MSLDSSDYPNVSVNLSIFDQATGRPVAAPDRKLDTSSFSLNPAGQITGVSESTADVPARYVLDIDTSGSMGEHPERMTRAIALAKAFVGHLGDNDYVKLLTFDKTTSAASPWLKGNDPALVTAIGNVKVPAVHQITNLSDGVKQAAIWANSADGPSVDRREVVIITDADSADNDLPKTTQTLGAALEAQKSPPVFMVGLIPLPVGDSLGSALADVGTQTGGSYQTSDTTKDATTEAATLFAPEWNSTKSTWKVSFTTDPVPGPTQPTETLTVHDTNGDAGTAPPLDYPSTGLFSKTQIDVKRADNSDFGDNPTLTANEKITASVGGYSSWKDGYSLELYVDCGMVNDKVDLTGCSLSAPSPTNGAALEWTIPVTKMAQGHHYAVVRLVASYGGKGYPGPTRTIDFERSGTTWNAAVVVLVGGAAVLLVGAFFITAQRRGGRRTKRAAR
jgi:hypothetical protein